MKGDFGRCADILTFNSEWDVALKWIFLQCVPVTQSIFEGGKNEMTATRQQKITSCQSSLVDLSLTYKVGKKEISGSIEINEPGLLFFGRLKKSKKSTAQAVFSLREDVSSYRDFFFLCRSKTLSRMKATYKKVLFFQYSPAMPYLP